jgi:hypothetical protein
MSERPPLARRPNPRARLLAAALAAVLAEALITLSAVFLDPPIPALVACHVGVGLLLAGLAWRRRQDADAAVFLLLAIATAGTGPFGALGMLAAMMADTRRPSEASAGEGSAGNTAGEISKRLHDSIVAGRELSGRSAGLASFRDILALGTFQDKQAALAIITRRFTPPLAPALRLALNDPDAAIRVQAATAAARIEDLFLAGLAQYTARVADLCPPERAAAEMEQALSHLRQAVALAPLRRDIRLAIAKVQLRRGDPREAARHLESLMEPLSADEILTYGEALHQISGWPKLRQLFASAMVRTDLPSQVSRMAALWAIPSETV